MYRYKLDVFIADEGQDVGSEEISMSFLLTEYPELETSPVSLRPNTWDERLEEMIALMPQAELAQLALALQIGRETKSTRLLVDCKELSEERIDELTDFTRLNFWRGWSQEVVVVPN
ncbi:MAG: hypothetical protein ACE361_26315 [Aureliella sp.]